MQLQSHSYIILQVLAPSLFIYNLPDQNVLHIYTLRDLFLKDICTLILPLIKLHIAHIGNRN